MQSFNINGCKVGSLPKEIFEINSLTSLLVENNNLTFIPSELFISQVTTLNL
jgi:Leucine-rich repeat (LRR) protein